MELEKQLYTKSINSSFLTKDYCIFCGLYFQRSELQKSLPFVILYSTRDHLRIRGYKEMFPHLLKCSYESFTTPNFVCNLCYNICVSEQKLIEVISQD